MVTNRLQIDKLREQLATVRELRELDYKALISEREKADNLFKVARKHCVENKQLREQLAAAVEALDKYKVAMDALYNHNAATRAAVVQYFGTLHPQAVLAKLEGK